jgi:hypothetical protein
MADVKNETIREAYEAPTIEDVPLRAEEQILRNCKNATPGSGQNAFPGSCVFMPACMGFSAS